MKEFDSQDYYNSLGDIKTRHLIIDNKFIFSYIWSLGGSLVT